MTTGQYKVVEVEDAGTAKCACDGCDWTGTADQTVEVQDCSLTPGDASPVGRCPECDSLVYLDKPLRGQTFNQRLFKMVEELEAYLREIRSENLDGSEPVLGELLEQSQSLRLELGGGDAGPEILPGATRQEITEIDMQDVVGEYKVPDEVPEWAWVERNACYKHCKNGQDGIWEFVLNLSCSTEDDPPTERFKAVLDKAHRDHCSYLIIHQGT